MSVIWGYVPFGSVAVGSGSSQTTVPIEIITASRELTDSDGILLVDTTGGAVTLTLPAAADFEGKGFSIKKVDSSTNAVTVTAASGESLDDVEGRILPNQGAAIDVVSDGEEWFIF